MSSVKKLSQLSENHSAIISNINCCGAMRNRLTALGLFPGASVKALFKSISGDPTAYLVQNCLIALRKCDAENIIIE